MLLEQGKISNIQFILLTMGYLLSVSVLLVPGLQAKQAAWIAIILGMSEGIVFGIIYILLSNRFQGKTLIEIHEIVYGRYLSKVISLAMLWYFFHLGSLILVTFKDFFLVTTLPRTPELVTTLLMIIVCAYAVRNGIEVLARTSQVLVILMLISFLFSFTFLLKNFDIKNFFPLIEVPWLKLLAAAHSAAVIPFGDAVALLMVIPFVNHQNKKSGILVPILIAFIWSGLLLVILSIRNIGVLGPTNGIYIYPTFQADRLINVGNLLTRLEIITVIGISTMGFVKIAVLLYATVLGGAQYFKLRTYRPLILPISILMMLLSLINFKNVLNNLLFAQKYFPFYALPFQVGIPLLTLIVAWIRGLPKKTFKR